MKIIQITDLHIPDISDSTHEIDILENITRVCKEIKSQDYDLLLITGDVAYKNPNHESYSYLQKICAYLDKPHIVLPGNHDDAIMLQQYFPIRKSLKKTYYTYTYKQQKFICLDSSKTIVDDEQMVWLQKELDTCENAIIFIHHPVIQTDVRFMESKHALGNRNELVQIFKKYNKSVTIFCGHFHIERYNKEENIEQYITPSLYYQIRPDVLHFEIGNLQIGYRIITIHKSQIATEVIWI